MAKTYYDDFNDSSSSKKGQIFDFLLVTSLGAVIGMLIAIQEKPVSAESNQPVAKAGFVGPVAPVIKPAGFKTSGAKVASAGRL